MTIDQITWPAFASIAGAALIAAVVVRYVRKFIDLSRGASRRLAAAVGLVVVVAATIVDTLQTATTVYDWIRILALAVVAGMAAGLGAAKAYEIKRDGIDHSTTRQ